MIMHRTRKILTFVGLSLLVGSGLPTRPASARIEVLHPFDIEEFERAQRAGEIIVVESYASWCLACKIQAPMLAKLKQDVRYRHLRIFKVGEYTPKPVWKRFRLKVYGMLVLYKGEREIGRLAGATSEAQLQRFLEQAN